jgi:hypothetical protein
MTLVSSVNSIGSARVFILLGRSFMYIKNKIGSSVTMTDYPVITQVIVP